MAAPPVWLADYYKRGFRLIFYPPQQKGPSGLEAKDWQKQSHTTEDYEKWLAKGVQPNVGVFLGVEIQPGKYLADVDFDWSEGLRLHRTIFPPTGFGFGRDSRRISHVFYTTPEPIINEAFKDIDEKTTFVEIRGATKDGDIGQQTMVPPSIHPSGEKVEIRSDDEIGHATNLRRAIVLYAVACILFKHLGDRGLLHDTRLGTAGFLLKEGVSEAEVISICTAVAEVTRNDVTDVATAVKSTANRLKAHEPVKGRSELIKAIGKQGQQVLNRIMRWLGREDFVYNDKGKILPDNESNITIALDKMDVRLAYDEFNNHQYIKYNGYEGQNKGIINNQVWLDIQSNFHFKPGLEFYYIVTDSIAYKRKFHPVRDYLDSLKWDGIPRLEEWLIKYGQAADSPYTRAVSAIVLIAAVRRIRQPGCKFDELMVLESEQGMFKSSALRALCPREEWFSDDLPLYADAKEIIERTTGKWIIEASELSGMSARNIDHLKSMLSREKDESRLAYGRTRESYPRQFIIIGTTNSHKYLQDETGNRRFWPIRLQQFNIPGLKAERDQLWAEAASREAQGESIRLDPGLYGQATVQQERRRIEDPWEITLRTQFGQPCPDEGCEYDPVKDRRHKRICKICGYIDTGGCQVSVDAVYSALALPVSHRTPAMSKRISAIMQGLGFVYGVYKDASTKGISTRAWIKKPPES